MASLRGRATKSGARVAVVGLVVAVLATVIGGAIPANAAPPDSQESSDQSSVKTFQTSGDQETPGEPQESSPEEPEAAEPEGHPENEPESGDTGDDGRSAQLESKSGDKGDDGQSAQIESFSNEGPSEHRSSADSGDGVSRFGDVSQYERLDEARSASEVDDAAQAACSDQTSDRASQSVLRADCMAGSNRLGSSSSGESHGSADAGLDPVCGGRSTSLGTPRSNDRASWGVAAVLFVAGYIAEKAIDNIIESIGDAVSEFNRNRTGRKATTEIRDAGVPGGVESESDEGEESDEDSENEEDNENNDEQQEDGLGPNPAHIRIEEPFVIESGSGATSGAAGGDTTNPGDIDNVDHEAEVDEWCRRRAEQQKGMDKYDVTKSNDDDITFPCQRWVTNVAVSSSATGFFDRCGPERETPTPKDILDSVRKNGIECDGDVDICRGDDQRKPGPKKPSAGSVPDLNGPAFCDPKFCNPGDE